MHLLTDRLQLRPFTLEDAPFILELVNEPAFIEYIGDKGVHSLADARDYLREKVLNSYPTKGFGLWHVSLRETAEPVGMAGILDRETLDDVDLGYALSERHCGQGYALEATTAVMHHARERLGLGRVVAIVQKDNARSIALLRKLAFRREGTVEISGDELELYANEP